MLCVRRGMLMKLGTHVKSQPGDEAMAARSEGFECDLNGTLIGFQWGLNGISMAFLMGF